MGAKLQLFFKYQQNYSMNLIFIPDKLAKFPDTAHLLNVKLFNRGANMQLILIPTQTYNFWTPLKTLTKKMLTRTTRIITNTFFLNSCNSCQQRVIRGAHKLHFSLIKKVFIPKTIVFVFIPTIGEIARCLHIFPETLHQ